MNDSPPPVSCLQLGLFLSCDVLCYEETGSMMYHLPFTILVLKHEVTSANCCHGANYPSSKPDWGHPATSVESSLDWSLPWHAASIDLSGEPCFMLSVTAKAAVSMETWSCMRSSMFKERITTPSSFSWNQKKC